MDGKFVTMDGMLNAERTAASQTHVRADGWWRALLIWEHPLWSALLAMIVYTMFAANDTAFENTSLWRVSEYGYFNYLADAFLHGQLYLRELPATTHDLSFFDGNY